MNKFIKKLSSIAIILILFFTIFCYYYPIGGSKVLAKTSTLYAQYTTTKSYSSNEYVEAIVVLESQPLMATFDEGKYDSIAEYVSSDEGKKSSELLIKEQQSFIELLEENNILVNLSNSYNYTVVMNAISIKTKVKNLDIISQLKGVKDVMLSNSYEALEVENSEVELEDVVYTDNFMDSYEAMSLGYTGEGMVVAVLDTGTDINHEVFQGDVQNPRFTKETLTEVIENANLTAKGVSTADVVYHSEKIPYAFDYAGNDSNAYISSLEHGTHVAGIVGANSGKIRGTAIDAQLFIMKVFDDNGVAYDTYILAGVEDCLKLGVDVANMSLGTPSGNSYTTEQVAEIYSQVREKGINLVVAAGNDSYVGNMNMAGNNLPLASATDYGVVASPSTYEYALSVASMDDLTYKTVCLNFEDKLFIEYAQTSNAYPINTILDGQTIEFVIVPNVGSSEDYADLDVTGKVVFVPRGTISFTEKHNAAVAAGAIAMIVYDPNENTLIGMQIENQEIPCVFITNDSFNQIQEAKVTSITFNKNDVYTVKNPTGGLVSYFSSWGSNSDLQIKPEITGPGGYIYSALPGGLYAEMSGTSMASPNVAGVAAIVRQYVVEKFPELSKPEIVDKVNQLLMNTADPIINTNNVYSSVRAQGSGVANALDAILTNGLVSVEGSERPKAELGYNENGVYSYTLLIENIGNESIEYILDTVVMTDEYEEYEGKYYNSLTSKILSDADVEVIYSSNVKDGKIVIKANESATVKVAIKLSDEYKEEQDKVFINGSYVEGYTFLKTITDEDLTIPFLGYYGDYESLPLMEDSMYDENPEFNMQGSLAVIFNASGYGYELGYDLTTETFYKDYIYYSCSNMKENVLTSYTTLYRNIDFAKFVITDNEGNIVYESSGEKYKKGLYSSNAGYVLSAYDYTGWDGVKLDGTKAVNGEEFTYTTTIGNYGSDGITITKQESWSFTFKIDSNAPEFLNSEIVSEDGINYLDIYAKDNVSANLATIYSSDYSYQLAEAVSDVEGNEISKFRFNLDEIIEYINGYNLNISQVKVEIGDWAYNSIFETIVIGPKTIKLDSSYKVAVNGTKDLSPIITPANVNSNLITYSSSDERIAVVSENGVVTGISDGETIITISAYNGVTAETKVIVGGSLDTSISITNGDLNMYVDDVVYLRAEILPLNTVDKTVIWSSSNENVATISSLGRLVAVGSGTAVITAISPSGNVDQITVNVSNEKVTSLFIYATFNTLYVGESKRIDMITITPFLEDYSNVIFTSSDDEVLSVAYNGVLTALKEGKATITISSLDGTLTSSINFVITNVNAVRLETTKQISLSMQSNYQIEVDVYPTNTTNKTLSFVSKNPDIAIVSENGLVTPISMGTAEIEITCGKVTTSCYVTISPLDIEKISSNEQFIIMNVGEDKQLDINFYPNNATFDTFFYQSSDSNIVSVIDGKIKANNEGYAIITVSTINGVSYEFFVIVNEIVKPDDYKVTFENIIMNLSDKSYSLDLTESDSSLIFSSSNEDIAVVANGKVYALNSGKTTIYVYHNAQLINTFTVEIVGNNNSITNYLMVIIETLLVVTILAGGSLIAVKLYKNKKKVQKL